MFCTANVDKLCIPFGFIIGPCTAVSNIIKVIGDIAYLSFNGLKTKDYEPSPLYLEFKKTECAWEKEVSSKHRPIISNGKVTLVHTSTNDPDYNCAILEYVTTIGKKDIKIVPASNEVIHSYLTAYPGLSESDKNQISFDHAKKDFFEHLTFIGIGIIRTIPVIGGIGRCLFNAKHLA